MSKQEVFDILYEVMETLPRELILLIREYMLFLPTNEEIRYFDSPYHIRIIPLTSECIILYGTHEQPLLLKDDEIIYRFHYSDIHVIHTMARYNNNSFLIAHDTTLDQIIIKPNHPVKFKIMNFEKNEIWNINVDKDGCIIASGQNGILIISHGQIIQRFFINISCHLHSDNIVIVDYQPHVLPVDVYRLTKTDKYRYDELSDRKLSEQITAGSGTFYVFKNVKMLSINSMLIKSPILLFNDYVYDFIIFQEKIYILTSDSIKIFHEALVV